MKSADPTDTFTFAVDHNTRAGNMLPRLADLLLTIADQEAAPPAAGQQPDADQAAATPPST